MTVTHHPTVQPITLPEEVTPWEPASPAEEELEYHGEPNPFLQVLVLLRDDADWLQGTYHAKRADGTDAYCLLGANMVVAMRATRYQRILLQAINARRLDEQVSISAWNDNTGRTFGQVERVLRRAAILWEREEGRID